MNCVLCEEPGRALCGRCLIRFRKTLGGVPELLKLLEDEKAGLSVKGHSEGSGSGGGDPLAHFATITENLRVRLRELYTLGVFHGAEAFTIPVLAQFLNNRAYRLQSYGGDLIELRSALNKINDAVRVCWRAVDNRPEITLLGACSNCHAGTVRAIRGHHAGWCPNCDSKFDARVLSEQRREQALEALGGSYLGAKDMTTAFAALGLDLNVNRVRVWAHRGKLTQHEGKTYLFDDVLDLFENAALSRG